MKVLIKIFCLMVLSFPNIKSCLLKYKNDNGIIPRFEKTIGKYTIRVPFRKSEKLYTARIYDKESVNGYCETYFSPINVITTYNTLNRWESQTRTDVSSNQAAITLVCHNDKLMYKNREIGGTIFSCVEKKWAIYSTKTPYGWCENNQNSTTFLLATQNAKNESDILAAFCFNMEQLLLQTLVYRTISLQRNNLNQAINTNNMVSNTDLDENLWNFKSLVVSDLSNENLKEKLNEMSKTDDWLNLANYEVSSIVQDELLMKYFKEYESILNVIWWHNLRVGNWKRFQNILATNAHNNSYEIYAGTSGVAQYPTDDKCQKEKHFEINLGVQNETVPAYIWNYLKSSDNSNKDFVVVGYNSPYVEYFTIEKIIFCPDICSEISWLKDISSKFRFSYAGIMFCCSTDFIKQTNYLQGFPLDSPQQQVATTVAIETTRDFTTDLNIQ